MKDAKFFVSVGLYKDTNKIMTLQIEEEWNDLRMGSRVYDVVHGPNQKRREISLW